MGSWRLPPLNEIGDIYMAPSACGCAREAERVGYLLPGGAEGGVPHGASGARRFWAYADAGPAAFGPHGAKSLLGARAGGEVPFGAAYGVPHLGTHFLSWRTLFTHASHVHAFTRGCGREHLGA